MNGILIISHGSRAKETTDTFNAVVDMARKKISLPIEIAYMEFSKDNIKSGLKKLIERGITHIKVVPYFLFNGIHIHEDIPSELKEFSEKHPNVTIVIGKTLGVDERIADVLVDRILE